MVRLEFWFDFASTYAYLSAMRMDALAADRGIEVVHRPFLLGPIFNAQGWSTSPFLVYPAKGRYMLRDLERLTTARGLAFRAPDPFPANGLHAARVGMVAAHEGWASVWTRSVFAAQFVRGLDIGRDDTLARLLEELGKPVNLLDVSRRPENKDALRTQTERAQSLGIFGAPSFTTQDGELFWGDDRLDAALDWAAAVR